MDDEKYEEIWNAITGDGGFTDEGSGLILGIGSKKEGDDNQVQFIVNTGLGGDREVIYALLSNIVKELSRRSGESVPDILYRVMLLVEHSTAQLAKEFGKGEDEDPPDPNKWAVIHTEYQGYGLVKDVLSCMCETCDNTTDPAEPRRYELAFEEEGSLVTHALAKDLVVIGERREG